MQGHDHSQQSWRLCAEAVTGALDPESSRDGAQFPPLCLCEVTGVNEARVVTPSQGV